MACLSSAQSSIGWRRFASLIEADDEARHAPAIQALRAAERTGRPLGNDDFVSGLETRLRRPLARRGPGRNLRPGTTARPFCCEP
jgi:hypothetical protein